MQQIFACHMAQVLVKKAFNSSKVTPVHILKYSL